MGLRPYLSLNAPTIGAHRNCTRAYDAISHPPYLEASEILPPVNSWIRAGITGIIIPRPITSNKSVMNMKPTAALRFFK